MDTNPNYLIITIAIVGCMLFVFFFNKTIKSTRDFIERRDEARRKFTGASTPIAYGYFAEFHNRSKKLLREIEIISGMITSAEDNVTLGGLLLRHQGLATVFMDTYDSVSTQELERLLNLLKKIEEDSLLLQIKVAKDKIQKIIYEERVS